MAPPCSVSQPPRGQARLERGTLCEGKGTPPLRACSLVPGHKVWRFHTLLSLSFVQCSALTAMPSGPSAGAAEGLPEAQAKEEKEA